LSGGAEFPDGQFLGWTPGQLPPLFDGDTAWWLDADSDLVVQLHMRPTDKRESVQVRIGLFFTDQAPQRTPVMVRLGKQDIDIAPGVADYRVEDTYRVPIDVSLLAIQPHAHYRAREVTVSVLLAERAREAVAAHRQLGLRLAGPVPVRHSDPAAGGLNAAHGLSLRQQFGESTKPGLPAPPGAMGPEQQRRDG
jgi:hypothetical protein